MTRLTILMLTVLFLSGAASKTQSDERTRMEVFLQNAVYHGLKSDSFPNMLAGSLVNDADNWVAKCPICDNVRRGIRKYLSNHSMTAEISNARVTAFDGASDGDMQTRKALKAMVDHYVEQYYDVLQMTDNERVAMEKLMKEGRKNGMNRASGGEGFFCPSCDGACGIE